MVDIHSHILWGMDDGAATFEESLAMLRLAAESGTTDIVATPHQNDIFDFEPDAARGMIERLREATGGCPRVHQGCELRLDYDNLAAAVADPKRYTIASGSYLLLEFGEFVPRAAGEVLQRLRGAGITPVIAHPERNGSLQHRPELLWEWASRSCVMQLTAQSVLGEMGRAARDCSWRLIETGLAHVVAADGHDTAHRPPRLDEVCDFISKKWSPRCAERLLISNPCAIIGNMPLAIEPDAPELPKKWFHLPKLRR